MQIFVNSVERLNGPVYSMPPCRVTQLPPCKGFRPLAATVNCRRTVSTVNRRDSISAELIYEIRHACDGLEL